MMTRSRSRSLFTPPPSCVLSDDGGGKDGLGSYRYELRIPLDGGVKGICLFILANPSTAVVRGGVLQPDPTITRGIGFASLWGYRTVVFANARAWRETNPKLVPPDPLAVGPDNDMHIIRLAREADRVVCGWGKLGRARGDAVLELLRRSGIPIFCLGQNNDGSPCHPLYLANETECRLMRSPLAATIEERTRG